jgi:hypothetical protein
MNLVLTFVHPSKPPKTLGPFAAIRFDAESLRETVNGAPVAIHRDHQWHVGTEKYFRLDTTTRVHCHFERLTQNEGSKRFGPFEQFSAIDGIAYVDDRVFAFVDTKIGDWFCYEDGHHWEVMVVSDASGGARSRLLSIAGLAPLLPGVIALWQGAKLLYLGQAQSIRSELERLADHWSRREISLVSWEKHGDPAAREAELLAEYERGLPSLTKTYGQLHGNLVRTARLIERARQTIAQSCRFQEHARMILATVRAAA